MALRIAPRAESELVEIWSYLAKEGSPNTADRIIDSIVQRIFLLSQHPYLGRSRDDLRTGLRSFSAGAYVIIYRIDDRDVLVLHVIHGRRDIQSLADQ